MKRPLDRAGIPASPAHRSNRTGDVKTTSVGLGGSYEVNAGVANGGTDPHFARRCADCSAGPRSVRAWYSQDLVVVLTYSSTREAVTNTRYLR
jgi:hypothetical protein